MPEANALAFDVFGTLGDLRGMAVALRPHTDEADRVGQSWRRHQLEISWLLSLMERYESFDAVTAYALDVALAEAGIELTRPQKDELLARAGELEVYEDVAPALDRLERAGFLLAVLSNGSPHMLESLLQRVGIRERFREVISVEEVRVFKPALAVYRHAAERLDRPLDTVWLVSANVFDCAGAKAAGMRVAAVERERAVRYAFAEPPDLVVPDLLELASTLVPTT